MKIFQKYYRLFGINSPHKASKYISVILEIITVFRYFYSFLRNIISQKIINQVLVLSRLRIFPMSRYLTIQLEFRWGILCDLNCLVVSLVSLLKDMIMIRQKAGV